MEVELQLYLPENLSNIEMSKIFKLRNSSGFMERQACFQRAFENYLEQIENVNYNNKELSFKKYLKPCRDEFMADIFTLGANFTAFGLSVAFPNVDGGAEWLQQMATFSALAGNGIAVSNRWHKSTRPNINARRYLADLAKLKKAIKN